MRRSPGAGRHDAELAEFDEFVRRVESRLRVALVATYGSQDGRAATVDALSWAWQHWERLQSLDSPVGYLFRVGQSATRRYAVRLIPIDHSPAERGGPDGDEMLGINPDLADAIQRLPVQQRTVVMLVHAFGWTQRDVAQLLEVNPSTVREHLGRAITRLSHDLEVRGVR